jgi:L-fucose mutarotase/ribose pyranase (RbsD/FucU family)
VPLAVNVVVPVPLELAVTVTVCGVLKLDEVNVRVVGDAVSPVFPLDAIVTVSLDVGAADRATVNVPVLLWATDNVAGVTTIDGVLVAVSVAVTAVEVYPEADAVNVVIPVPLELAVTVTVCGVLKLDGVNVRLAGEAVSPVFPLAAMLTVVLLVGACDSARVNVPVPP